MYLPDLFRGDGRSTTVNTRPFHLASGRRWWEGYSYLLTTDTYVHCDVSWRHKTHHNTASEKSTSDSVWIRLVGFCRLTSAASPKSQWKSCRESVQALPPAVLFPFHLWFGSCVPSEAGWVWTWFWRLVWKKIFEMFRRHVFIPFSFPPPPSLFFFFLHFCTLWVKLSD